MKKREGERGEEGKKEEGKEEGALPSTLSTPGTLGANPLKTKRQFFWAIWKHPEAPATSHNRTLNPIIAHLGFLMIGCDELAQNGCGYSAQVRRAPGEIRPQSARQPLEGPITSPGPGKPRGATTSTPGGSFPGRGRWSITGC